MSCNMIVHMHIDFNSANVEDRSINKICLHPCGQDDLLVQIKSSIISDVVEYRDS